VVTRNLAAIRRLTRDPNGPIGRDLRRRGGRVRDRAKVLCPVDKGRLRAAQIATDAIPTSRGFLVQIGSNVEYSLAVHEGSNSPFAPRSWRHARRPVPARRYLTNALPAGRG
jgi:hypothetical protein